MKVRVLEKAMDQSADGHRPGNDSHYDEDNGNLQSSLPGADTLGEDEAVQLQDIGRQVRSSSWAP